jgi:hypothetical protein
VVDVADTVLNDTFYVQAEEKAAVEEAARIQEVSATNFAAIIRKLQCAARR